MATSTTWTHIRRSPYQALAAILIMLLTFLVLSVFSFLLIGSSKVIGFFESTPRVTAFFTDDAKQQDIDALMNSLKQSGQVSSMKFVTKQEALKIYKQQNADTPAGSDLVTDSMLPSSLEVSATRPENLANIYKALKTSPIVYDVVYLKEVVSKLITWSTAMKEIGIVLIVVLSMVSIFIMATIIGFKISQKREEIEIMRLLSATNWYVRWPFILEGMFYAVIGAILGWGLSYLGLIYATPYLKSFLEGIPSIFPLSIPYLLLLLGFEICFAIILGAFSSFLAVLRYLK